MKGYKFFILLLSLGASVGLQAETVPDADPEYIYIQRSKAKEKKPADTKKQEQIVKKENAPEVIIIDSVANPAECILPLDKAPLIMTKEEAEKKSAANASNVSQPAELEEFGRDIESVEFVPKGQWIVGLSVSYSQSSQDKYQFLILEGISGDTYTFKVSPMLMFAIKADWALGGRFSYNRSLTKVANADIILDSETDYSFDHLYRLSHNYYGSILMRNYFSIGKSKRFGFFNEVSLQVGGGQTKLTTGVGNDLTGTYERNFGLNVGITPGLCIFLSNYSALELNVGVLGFNYSKTKAIKDQIYVSSRDFKLANFRINLFSITFGATFYI